ncbi:MAG: ribosome biogenesis GTPase Der [Chloroflexi bacterium]|nr:ribosome biogenesis GTPase Der [Chloroflexota bacterium]
MTTKPIVAIVGRQNVGTSTLFNRIVGRPVAIVEDLPGTTRDRLMASVTWEGHEFILLDTGGIEPKPATALSEEVKIQAERAMAEADVILFLVDVKDGLVPADLEIAETMRRASKPVVLVANKADNARLEAQAAEFYQLGLGEPEIISAYHKRGMAQLLDRIAGLLPGASSETETGGEVIKIAIVGKPNVGKSMLLNALLGEERAIVAELPGTTRDALDTPLDFQGQNMVIIDTAGIRRRGRVERGIEQYSVMRALQAIERADVALLVIDAAQPLSAQDTHIAGYIQQSGKGVIIVVNKWDLLADKNETEYTRYVMTRLRFLAYAAVLFVSAKTRQAIAKILPKALEVYRERHKQLSPEAVNDTIQQAVAAHSPPRRGGRQLKIFKASQTGVNPPTFTLRVNDASLVHFSYKRYLENRLRRAFGFAGTPVSLVFKPRGEA